jgi:hypothetical protein
LSADIAYEKRLLNFARIRPYRTYRVGLSTSGIAVGIKRAAGSPATAVITTGADGNQKKTTDNDEILNGNTFEIWNLDETIGPVRTDRELPDNHHLLCKGSAISIAIYNHLIWCDI